MPSWLEIQAAMTGLKRLARFDASFVQWFDRSPAGALRSFGLMIPALPLFLILRFVAVDVLPDVEAFRLFAVTAINYVLSWIMFPLILIAIGRTIGREAQAISALACYNWFGVALMTVSCLLTLLDRVFHSGDAFYFLSVLLQIASLIYEGYMLRVLMGLGYGGAALLAIIDYVLAYSLYILLMSPIMATTVS
jgi:hypothetical protein